MKTYVLAIGGTGARVLRSLTMLMAAGAGVNKPNPDGDTINEIVPVIIDYDIENGDTKRTQDLLCKYKWIHDAAYSKVTKAEDIRNFFFGTKVEPIGNPFHKTRFEVFLDPVNSNLTFANQIGYESINSKNGMQPTRYLLDSLYDTSPEDSNLAELNLNLKVGFKGCPNIGCVVMRDLKNTHEIQQILELASGNRVIIVGSVFGGTGASGIPVLLNEIKKSGKGADITTGIVAVEPYFEVQKSDRSAISSSTFLSKTKAAFDAYIQGKEKSVNSRADAIYYVGDRLASKAFENNEGGASQKNDAHIAELAAAMCILDFTREDKVLSDDKKFHVVNLEDDGGMSKSDNYEEVAEPFNYYSFPQRELREDYIDPLCRLAILKVYCDTFLSTEKINDKNIVWAAPNQSNFRNETDFMFALFNFLDEYKDWIKELENPMHPLRLFDFSDGYGKLFTDLLNKRKSGLFGSSLSNVIDNDSDISINAKLNEIYKKNQYAEHLKGQNRLLFLKFAGEATKDMFDRVLDVTYKNRKQ